MTDEEKVERILAQLDAMAEEWSERTALPEMVGNVIGKAIQHYPTELRARMISHVVTCVKQGFVEGAVRCYYDAKDGKIPWLKVVN